MITALWFFIIDKFEANNLQDPFDLAYAIAVLLSVISCLVIDACIAKIMWSIAW